MNKTVNIRDSDFTDSKSSRNFRTVHHENGHAFDHLSFRKLKGKNYDFIGGKRVTYMSGLPEYDLENKTYNDLWRYINGDLKQLSELGKRPRKKVEKIAWENERMEILEKARQNVATFENKINSFKNESDDNINAVAILSDIVESTRMIGDYPFGYGHGSSYWKQEGSKEAEFFAHATSARASDEVATKLLNEIFPESMATYDRILNDITGDDY